MSKKTVLVTGATGFIGRPLVKELVCSGYAVRVLVRDPARVPAAAGSVVVPDISGPVAWEAVLDGIEIVVHLAGLAHTEGADPYRLDAVNRLATQNLATAAGRCGVERFIFVSSIRAQAGPSAPRPVREDDPLQPVDDYGRSKLAAEAALGAAGVPFTIFRPAVLYGPHPQANMRAMLRLAGTPWPLPFAGLDSRRSLLAIDNFISAVLFALNSPATIGGTFLLADPVPYAVSEIFAMLRKAQGRPPALFYVPPSVLRAALRLSGQAAIWRRLGEPLVADVGKLQTLGWKPAIATYDGLLAMVQAEQACRNADHRAVKRGAAR